MQNVHIKLYLYLLPLLLGFCFYGYNDKVKVGSRTTNQELNSEGRNSFLQGEAGVVMNSRNNKPQQVGQQRV